MLRNISSEYGRVKAWIRACLNEHSLEKYILLLLENETTLIKLYESWSLIRDSEKSAVLPNCAAGLKSILFALSVDNSAWNDLPLKQPANIEEQHIPPSNPSQVVKIKKKKKVNVVPLNEEMDASSFSSSGRSSPSSTFSLTVINQSSKRSNHNRSSSLDLSRLVRQSSSSTQLKHNESCEEFLDSYSDVKDHHTDDNVITPVSHNGESPSLVPVMQQVKEAASALSNVLNYPNCSQEDYDDKSSDFDSRDLRQAVVDMMERKDEAEQKAHTLTENLNEERLKVLALKSELQSSKEKQDREAKALREENSLLKRQLKKYVNAVQLLRGGATVDQLPIHVPEVTPIPPALPPNSIESDEYEKKLIEVADMHGELIEFNEILQKQINQKENLIKNLRSELTELRGPLPSILNSDQIAEE